MASTASQASDAIRLRGRLSTNLLANFAGLSLNLAVGVFFTPFLIRHLGIAAYGVVPLATTVSSYFSVFTLIVNAAVGRFITIALEREAVGAAVRYFNTSVVASVIVAVALMAPGIVLAVNVAQVLRVPAGYEASAGVLVLCTVGVVIVSVLSGPFDVATFCKNRFEVRNAILAVATSLRVGIVVALFSFGHASLAVVGAAAFGASVVSAIGSLIAWRRLTPELRIAPSSADKATLKELAGYGGWVSLNQTGTLLLLSVDLLVVNRSFGPADTGRYASVLQWPILLRSIALSLSGVLGPTMFRLYARNDLGRLVAYSRTAVKVLGLAMALPVGLLVGLAPEVLRIWLGESFAFLAPLLVLMVLPLAINLAYLPLNTIPAATKNIRVPGLVQLAAGLANLGLALLLSKVFGWGMYGVAAAGVAVLTARNLIFTPLFAAVVIGESSFVFMREVVPVLVSVLVVAALSRVAGAIVGIGSWVGLFAWGAGFALVYVVAIWNWVLRSEDKRVLAA